jgi:hypothetical protein
LFKEEEIERSNSLFGPFVLSADLVLFLRGKVVLDVERLTNLFGGLALKHVGDSLASDIEQRLDVKVVGCLESSQYYPFSS